MRAAHEGKRQTMACDALTRAAAKGKRQKEGREVNRSYLPIYSSGSSLLLLPFAL
jgi:hypothetical protein